MSTTTTPSPLLLTADDVRCAAKRIQGHAIRTPLLQSHYLNDLVGATVYIKPENLQRTGSFKFRGACNSIAALMEEAQGKSSHTKRKSVVAVSSGNHAQGIAEAARLFDCKATIVMPSDAPSTKMDRTQRSGATVILYDRQTENREAIAQQFVDRQGAVLIHPFEHPEVIAGQGTAGLEVLEDLQNLNITPDHVLVCTGGGGFLAGMGLVLSPEFPNCQFHSCEPQHFDDYARSLKSGQREHNTASTQGALCDAIVTPSPGVNSLALNRQWCSDGYSASDDQVLLAIALLYHELKLVVEPGGAIAMASLLNERQRFQGKTVVVTLSGGNMDGPILQRALEFHERHGSYIL